MNKSTPIAKCHPNLASAAINALDLGREIRLSVCPKSVIDRCVFRVINQNGKPDYDHPAIAIVLDQVAAKSNHVAREGNALILKS